MASVAELKVGQKGIIKDFSHSILYIKLLEMGCLPGSEIELCCKAPLGSPLCVKVCGYHLALRKDEAQWIDLVS